MKKVLAGILMLAVAGCGHNQNLGIKTTPPPVSAPPPPPKQTMSLDPALADQARSEIAAGMHSHDEVIRANSIEAAQDSNDQAAFGEIIAALSDKSSLVRFAACMAVGQLHLGDAIPRLQQMLADPDPNVQIGVRFALHKLGDFSHTNDLEKLASHPDRDVRGNVALAVGLLGEPSGRKVLLPMLKDREAGVRLQAAEALWRLGDQRGLDELVVGSISSYADDQVVSIMGLAEPGDRRVLPHLRGKLASDPGRHDEPEIGLVAARAMGMLGSDEGYTVAANGAKSTDPRLKSLGALALGAIGRSDAQPILSPLLKDPSQPVRIAAATAILQLKAG